MIRKFSGKYRFLSNFSGLPFPIEYMGLKFTTVEAAYQAAKCRTRSPMKPFQSYSPGFARTRGRDVVLRPDWEQVKVPIMYGLLQKKFALPDMATKLVETYPHKLVEENWWHDTFWGVCQGQGNNMLGILLMQIRKEWRNG